MGVVAPAHRDRPAPMTGRPGSSGLRPAIASAGRGLWWYLKQATGEAKWEEYLEECLLDGRQPMSRRDFERHRADVREHSPQSRCC